MKVAFLSAAAVALVFVAGAQAQPLGLHYDRNGTETVLVRPDYGPIQKQYTLGVLNGEINPTLYSLSQSVNLADLDMAQPADRQEMRNRVYDTAFDLCYALDARMHGRRDDENANRKCVQTATRDAISNVMERSR